MHTERLAENGSAHDGEQLRAHANDRGQLACTAIANLTAAYKAYPSQPMRLRLKFWTTWRRSLPNLLKDYARKQKAQHW
jgi:hypothetical protein